MVELTCPGLVGNEDSVAVYSSDRVFIAYTVYSSDSKYTLLKLLEEEQPASRMAGRIYVSPSIQGTNRY